MRQAFVGLLDMKGTSNKCVILLTGQECREVRMLRAYVPGWRFGFPFGDNIGLGKGKHLPGWKRGKGQDGSQVVLTEGISWDEKSKSSGVCLWQVRVEL